LKDQEKRLYLILIIFLSGIITAAFRHQGLHSTLHNLVTLQLHPGRLINDFTLVGGTGAALLNAALASGLGLILVYLNKVSLSGPTLAAFFTIFGFGLFGKTPLNILPIFFGVYLSAKVIGKSYQEYILIALFGTALGPLVTFMVFELGFTGTSALLIGIAAGISAGFLLPPIARSILHMHQGYNLYNIGLTCGFLGLFVAGLIEASGRSMPIEIIWNPKPSKILIYLIPIVAVLLISAGLMERKQKAFVDLLLIQRKSGRLPSDFVDNVSQGGTLINMGLLAIVSWLYVVLVGGKLNGPVLGGIFTIIGFGAFGKHLKNCWPVVLGVVVACLVFGKDLADPGPILAALFVTTLAPIAGQFGPFTGIVAGFLHLTMVERTAAWHGGLDLYNNGFAGGLTATLMIAVLEWYKEERRIPG
jgi:hypothetical protein